MNNPGTIVMQVADLSEMLVVAQINEADVGGVEVGQTAVVRARAYPDEEFEGVVESVGLMSSGPVFESQAFRVEVLLTKVTRPILWGLTAEVDIQVRRHTDVMKIQSQAVIGVPVDDLPPDVRKDSPHIDPKKTVASIVYCMVDGKAMMTPVEVGASDATHTVVLYKYLRDHGMTVGLGLGPRRDVVAIEVPPIYL